MRTLLKCSFLPYILLTVMPPNEPSMPLLPPPPPPPPPPPQASMEARSRVRNFALQLCSAELLTVTLQGSNMTNISADTFLEAGYDLQRIQDLLIMKASHLEHIDVEMFKQMPRLQSIYINQAPRLHRIPTLPSLPGLKTFGVINSGLVEVPNLSKVHENNHDQILHVLDLEGNHIRHIPAHALRVRADQVSLNYNQIHEIPAHAFKNAEISKLSLKGNTKLTQLDEHAFAGNLLLRELDLSYTAITHLPTKGLEKLEVLRIERTPTLKVIPSIYYFQYLQEAHLTHHFHCCAFAFPEIHDPERHKLYVDQRNAMAERCKNHPTSQPSSVPARRRRSLVPPTEKTTSDGNNGWGSVAEDVPNSPEYVPESYSDETYIGESTSLEDSDEDGDFHEQALELPNQPIHADCGNFTERRREISCGPQPDALNPCEDVMGWRWLRSCVWVVALVAIAGNCAVLLVLLAHRSDLTVPKFLMCHLAFADLCTGLYLMMLAGVDLLSYGEYFNYAYDWQYGAGCKVAGFLSVFSGQLSVYTLAIVTLERWFAITYAIYLDRRISLLAAAEIMAGGWVFAAVMAGLPLAGISDYSSTSICLPVESIRVADGIYQGSLFLTNAVAWLTIVGCYVQIYRSLGGSEGYGGRAAAAAAERRIANKMALLVGTDLLCWAPVAFFGITALAGVPLVDVTHGKVLLVFFYPLNACANPFLYAILTKQYRRDLVSLVARQGWCGWAVARYKAAATPPPTGNTAALTATGPVPLLSKDRPPTPILNGRNCDQAPLPLISRNLSHPDRYKDQFGEEDV